MKTQSNKLPIYDILFFVIVTVLVIYPSGGIHAQQPILIKIKNLFSNSQVIFPFVKTEKIYGLAISGSIHLYKNNSLIRVILVGDYSHEYLVYEAYPSIVDNNSVTIINACEESCIIEGISPHSLKIELIDASLQIDEMVLTDYPPSLKMEPAAAQLQIKKERDSDKIEKINENIKKTGQRWIAGETSISQLTYEKKKKLFGADKVPNLQGAEFYKGGIFEVKSGDSSSFSSSNDSSSLIESFDWRNRHGANNPDSPYFDGDPIGSGWITSVKNQSSCGSCWAFAATGATEALANIYFNEHIDLDLSEQEVLSCSGAGSCNGGLPGLTLDYYTSDGVVEEACFPYTARDDPCDKCPNPDEIIKINGKVSFSEPKTEYKLKKMIIDYGPVSGGIYSWSHAMTLVGYGKDTTDGETFWIFKNSWGNWGDHGYGYLKIDISDIGWTHGLLHPVFSLVTPYEINCFDYDGDGYYNWGIAEDKPTTCPTSALPDKDCDDSNPYLGPFNNDGSCKEVLVFEDVPPGYWTEDAIYKIYEAGITTGCSKNPLMFCPERTVTRAQMAVFLGRGIHGSSFIPPPATGIFEDVPVSYWAADWIEQFYDDGITTGCRKNPLKYCPGADVTRTQIAIFLLRSKHGSNYMPPSATGIFSDVPVTYWAADWIEQLYREGITKGCQENPLMYCPESTVKRAQMAVFMTRTFGLTLKDGVVASYPFNGNANDESGNGNDGTVHGATLTTDRFGDANSAYDFDGVDDYVDCGGNENFNMAGKSFTISAWVKTTDLNGAIVTKHDGSFTGEWIHGITPPNKFRFGGSQFGNFRDTNVAVNNEKWHHLVGVIVHNDLNDNDLYQYIDGISKGSLNSMLDIDSGDGNVLIGDENNLDWPFEGLIDDIRIYNRALSTAEIKALYYLDE